MRRLGQGPETDGNFAAAAIVGELPRSDGCECGGALGLRLEIDFAAQFEGEGHAVERAETLQRGAQRVWQLAAHAAVEISVLRRVQSRTGDGPPPTRSHARFAGWNLDLSSRELMSPTGEEVRLTTGEFDLLTAFVSNANQVLSRDRLLDLARNPEAGPFDRTIDVQVGRLRRKLEDDPQNPSLIKTVRGSGYIFTPSVDFS